ncbi:MAG: NifU family protein [Actinobacteria bacterium]|nr:NifU family protein [Actinomycetota bacterium]|tara:strand:+ start:250 stop:822 length:573 start_codon:yes stop_codon:yes gene_type:complete
MSQQDPLKLSAMPTPNPNTVKFNVNREFFERGSVNFTTPEDAQSNPLAKALFDVDGLVGVMIGKDFVSISKHPDVGWEKVIEPASDTIERIATDINEVVTPALLEALTSASAQDSEDVQKIKHILDEEIRPAIAMDGGDCEFHSYENGILTLNLQGACSSCPSATMTLKMGIENRLKEEIPDLKEVVQIL